MTGVPAIKVGLLLLTFYALNYPYSAQLSEQV
jgi:hypothetical protein